MNFFRIKNMYKYIGIIIVVCMAFMSCEPDTGVVPFDYPESAIYFPAAQAGTYIIDALSAKDQPTATDPEAGSYKYIANKAENVFEIPLAVYRGGIHPDGDITFDIVLDEDTVNALIASGSLEETILLPADKYVAEQTLGLGTGERTASFSVKVDFSFLYENAGQKYAFALQIEGPSVSSDLGTIIVVIDTQMLIPTIEFSTSVDAVNYKLIYFVNSSKNIASCTWDFGDGTTSTEAAPSHAYEVDGTYQATLTVAGLYGDELTTSAEVVVSPPITEDEGENE